MDRFSFTHKCRIILPTTALVSSSVTNPEPYKRLRLTFTVLMFFWSTKRRQRCLFLAPGSVIVSRRLWGLRCALSFNERSCFFFCRSKAEVEQKIAASELGNNLSGVGWDGYLEAMGSSSQQTNHMLKRDLVWK